MRRILLLALVALGVVVPPAQAKLYIADVGNRTFTPGELLELQMPGCNAFCGREVGGRLAALAPVVHPASIKRLCAAKRWPLTHVTRRGMLRFLVPDVPSGRYQIVVRYLTNPKMPCKWGWISAPFRVVGAGG